MRQAKVIFALAWMSVCLLGCGMRGNQAPQRSTALVLPTASLPLTAPVSPTAKSTTSVKEQAESPAHLSPTASFSPVVAPTGTPTLVQSQTISVDQTAAYELLPQITVALDCWLAPSPSHPADHVPDSALRAGDRVRLLGTNQDGTWLLVIHKGILGWLPVFYSRTPTGTLKPSVVVENALDACTAHIGTVLLSSVAWSSPLPGAAVVQGLIYHPQVENVDSAVVIEVEGAGPGVQVDLARTPIVGGGETFFFVAEIVNLQQDSHVHFRLIGLDEPVAFQASFFTRDCAEEGLQVAASAAGDQPAVRPPTPGPTPTPVVIKVNSGPGAAPATCRPGYDVRLGVGQRAYVTSEGRVNVRSYSATRGSSILGQLQSGDTVTITDGPECADDMFWWRIESSTGLLGWVSEGTRADGYLLAPLVGNAPPPTSAAPPPAARAIASNRGSLTQGQNGWTYQYEEGRNSVNMTSFSIRALYHGVDCFLSPREDYVRLCTNGELHPGQQGRVGYRWDSSYSGSVTIQVHAHKIDTGGGDGIWVGTFIGQRGGSPHLLGQFNIRGSDNQGVTQSYPVGLSTDSFVLVLVDIVGQAQYDQSRVYIDIVRE